MSATSSVPVAVPVPCAGLIDGEFGELTNLDEIEVLLDRTLDSSIHHDTRSIELGQSAIADTSHDNGTDVDAAKRCERLALPMRMDLVSVDDRFDGPTLGFDDDEGFR
jgi:hypothetical protein